MKRQVGEYRPTLLPTAQELAGGPVVKVEHYTPKLSRVANDKMPNLKGLATTLWLRDAT